MNRTLLTLAGLLLAAPLAAQQPSVNERKASELLQQSAQKALAGYESEAAKLANEAMLLLAKEPVSVKGRLHRVEEHVEAPQSGVMIVENADGREVIEFITREEITEVDERERLTFTFDVSDSEGHDQVIEMHDADELELLAELGYIGQEGEEGMIWSTAPHALEEYIVMGENSDHHFAPMDNGDLHQQLREIQHELESLRHELHALRSEMSGGGRRGGRSDMGGMQGNRRVMRFPGGEWNSDNNQGMSGNRLQLRMLPGQIGQMDWHSLESLPQRLELHGIHDNMELHELKLHEMGEIHELLLDGGSDLDFEFEGHEGAEIHEEVVVIINGEKFTGDAARKKLEELNMDLHGEAGGRVQMRMKGNRQVFPTPPMPPKAPQPHRRSNGHDHEDA